MNGAEKFGFNELKEKTESMNQPNIENRRSRIEKAMERIRKEFEIRLVRVMDTLAENPYFSTQDERGF